MCTDMKVRPVTPAAWSHTAMSSGLVLSSSLLMIYHSQLIRLGLWNRQYLYQCISILMFIYIYQLLLFICRCTSTSRPSPRTRSRTSTASGRSTASGNSSTSSRLTTMKLGKYRPCYFFKRIFARSLTSGWSNNYFLHIFDKSNNESSYIAYATSNILIRSSHHQIHEYY